MAGRVLAVDPGVTAVFAADDQMALGVLLALDEARTVRQDFEELGQCCLVQLLGLLEAAGRRSPT